MRASCLDHIFAREPGMPRRAAGGDLDRGQATQIVLGNVHRVEIDLAGVERNAALDGIADGARLLVDLLEHEMLEAALLRHDRVPGDPLLLGFDDIAVKIGDADRVFGQDRDLVVAEKENVARVCEDRRNVGRDKKFAVAQADHDRRAFANGDDRVGFVHRNDRQRKNAAQLATAFRTAFSSDKPSLSMYSPIRWATTSVSVSV